MEYDSEDKHLKISVRLFLNDLEQALSPHSGLNHYDITDKDHWERTQELLKNYFGENLKVQIKNKDIPLVYLGSEIEADAMWCYLEAKKVRPFDQITVQYTALKEIFADQENLVHLRLDGEVRSCRVYGDQRSCGLVWD